MSALLEGNQASSSSKASDRSSSGKQSQGHRLSSTIVLKLVALHSALQAAAKKGDYMQLFEMLLPGQCAV